GALQGSRDRSRLIRARPDDGHGGDRDSQGLLGRVDRRRRAGQGEADGNGPGRRGLLLDRELHRHHSDRKSTRLNSSHVKISSAHGRYSLSLPDALPILERSKARVTALGYFEPDPMTGVVEIETRKGSSDEWIVAVVRVKERPTGTVQVGAGFSSIESFIGTVQISQTNFFGWGQSVQLQAQISSLRQFIQLQVVAPYFLDTRWTASVNFYRTELDYGGFRRNATGGDLTFGHPIPLFDDDDLRLFLTLTAENVDVLAGGSLVGSVPLHGRFFSGFASSARLTLNWDRRNNRLFPSRGFVQSASVERTLPSPLSEIDYTRYTGVTRWYFSLPLRLVLKFQGT